MKKIVYMLLLLGGVLCAAPAWAGIIASATRVIFNEGEDEQSLMLFNTNAYPIVVQTWADNGDVNAIPELSRAPFITLPAVFGMQPNAMKGLRIIYNQQLLPADRESVFWINLYEIPPNQPVTPPLQSSVVMAMNTQMKIFYRPKALVGEAANAVLPVFSLQKDGKHYVLICNNNSAFHLSFASLSVRIGQRDYPVQQESDMMTAPYSKKTYYIDYIDKLEAISTAIVNAAIIDDQGYSVKKQYPVGS